MKAIPWIVAGIGIGVGVTLLVKLMDEQPEYATGYDGVERAARKTFGWGTKARAKGKVESIAGAVKEGVGRITGNDDLAGEGSVQRAAGNIADAAGTVGQGVAQTIHDLNR